MQQTPNEADGTSWILSVERSGAAAQQFPLEPGSWTVGPSADCDVRLDSPADACITLDIAAGTASVTWPPQDGGAALAITVQDDAQWSMGSWRLHLHRLVPPRQAIVTPSRSHTGWSGRLLPFALAATMLTTSLVAAGAWQESWGDSPLAEVSAAQDDGVQRLSNLLKAHGLDQVAIAMPEEPGAEVVLKAALVSQEACDRYTRWREEAGPGHFTDRVACVPEVLRSADEFLAGTGVSTRFADGRLMLVGRIAEAALRPRVDAVVEQLSPLLAVEVAFDERPIRSPQHDSLARQVRSKVAGLHQDGPTSHLLMRDGERVFEGGRLQPDMELVRIGSEAITVRRGGHDIDIPL